MVSKDRMKLKYPGQVAKHEDTRTLDSSCMRCMDQKRKLGSTISMENREMSVKLHEIQ